MYFLLCIWGNSRRKPFVSRSHTTHIAAISVRGVQVPFSPSHFTTPRIDFLSIRSRLELKTCFLHQNSSNIPKFWNLVGGSFLGWVAPGSHSEPCPTVHCHLLYTHHILSSEYFYGFIRGNREYSYSWLLMGLLISLSVKWILKCRTDTL